MIMKIAISEVEIRVAKDATLIAELQKDGLALQMFVLLNFAGII
jgi:hypothetical protein